MDKTTAERIAKRFLGLPLGQRRQILEKMTETGQGFKLLPIVPSRHETEHVPLSYAQQRQWFLWQLEPESAAYNIPAALRLKGELEIEALRSSFEALSARHETLRTTIRQDGEQALQIIHPASAFPLEAELVAVAAGSDQEALLKEMVETETQRPFDLARGPLLRVKLLRLAEYDHVLILTLHHIVSDGWSMPIMVDELVQLYEGHSQGREVHLPELPIQYADYAIWQRSWMEAGEKERQLAYWKEQLGEEQPVLELPTDRPRPAIRSHAGAKLAIELNEALAKSLKQLAQQQGVTLFMLLLASFQTLLHRYSGQDDIRVGVPIANRNRAETEGLIGFFVNTQVLKAEFDLHTTFSDLLKQVQQTSLAAQAHQDLPFEQLVEALHPERSLSHNPLFQVMYNHQSQARGESRRLPGLTVEGLSWEQHTAQLDLTLDTFEHSEGIGASLNYATALFDKPTIERLAQHWLNLLEGIAKTPTQRIEELSLLSQEEHQQILYDWNRTEASYPSDQRIHQLIEAQAEKAPDAVAVIFDNQELGYRQLNQKANQLAHKLRELGVGPDVLVGIAVERSLEMVIGLLAILKAGGAYVPLDPEYPQERLAYMIEDSGIQLLLSQSHLQNQLPVPSHVQRLELDQGNDWLKGYSEANPANFTQPENLAYVIYTSGSTGRPKGTLLPHHNVIRLFRATEDWYQFDACDVWSVFHSYAFDFSVWELFGALVHGAKAVVVPKEVARSPEDFHALLLREKVTVLNQTPSAFKQLIPVAVGKAQPLPLRYVIFGGEALDIGSLEPWFEAFGDRQPQLINMYGITETTVHVTYRPISLEDLNKEAVSPIGEVIQDLSWYLLDDNLGVAMPGSHGELHVGRAGLARGYHQRPALTAERFIPDPFDNSGQGGGRLYRTGDLARYRGDGVIEYAGRIDHQVKVRGFRIELGEIESRLQEHEAVRESVVIDIEGPSGKQLAAYLVTDTDLADDPDRQVTLRTSLRDYLKESLPDYMVPAHLVFLDKLPLTPNGKLDRKALPKPDTSQLQQKYIAPQSELEQQIATIWADVLKVEKVGLTDNFFELGGHSLLATQVISRIRKALNIELPLRTLFEAPVLAEFTAHTRQGTCSTAPAFQRVDRNQPLALSYAQQRQWFLWQLEPESVAYNIPTALRLKGELDIEALCSCFDALIARHETLRTTFREEGERAIQIIHQASALSLDAEPVTVTPGSDLEALLKEMVETETQRPFDLARGPLLRVKLLRLAEYDHVLILTLHHIVSDGWSMPIMVDELVRLYEGYRTGQHAILPELPIQYADYAIWQRSWMEAGERERQLAYWKEQLGEEQPVLELPTDRPRPTIQSYVGANLAIELNEALAKSLKQLAQQQGATLFMLLLASFQALLHRYSGQDDIRVGVPIANRNRSETEGLIGFFVNTQVLKAEFGLDTTFCGLLRQVQQTALGAQAHQDLPFEQLVEALHPERSLSHSPLFQVMYNHQTQVKGEGRSLPGLSVEELSWGRHTAQFDLTLDTFEHEHGIGASLSYASALFDKPIIERLAQHWLNLLEGIAKTPTQRIAELSLLHQEEHQRIVYDWNRTKASYPSDQCTHQLIEIQVEKTPDAVAVIFDDQELSYRQLNQRANQLAHKLRELGVGPDVLVGIAVERSLEMVVGLLAILKAGGAYVPLDPEYPRERLAYMIEDSGVGLLLTQSYLQDQLPIPEGVQSLSLDQGGEWLAGYSETDPVPVARSGNLAYVIYTSGSTGKPKGAGNTHDALVNRLCWMQKAYALNATDRVLQKTPFSFDVSVWEFFWPLLSGARLVVAQPGAHRDPEQLIATIRFHGVTTLHFVPSMLQAFLVNQWGNGCESIRRVICSGEALPVELSRQVREKLPGAGLFNLYGPTEAAIDVTHWTCGGEDARGVPIGRPIDNLKTHILEGGLRPALQGSTGELYLGGVGLARGYHDRPALTAERFIPDPLDEQGGGRLYRTGDLARYRTDAVIEYVGRIDYQVKIRGFRIELGEIEARLLDQASVREAVVLAQEGPGGKQLVGYVVPSDAQVLESSESSAALRETLRSELKVNLPEYMVPAHLLFLQELPLTPNGKLDRKSLPLPDATQPQGEYIEPRTDLERQIASIWADVLKLEKIGLADNFFDLGGDSIISLQVVSRARQAGIQFTPKELFQHQTVQGIAAVARCTSGLVIDQRPVTGSMPLTPIQKWFFEEEIPQRHHWNQSVLLKPGELLDGDALEPALQVLLEHHDALRLRFYSHSGEWQAEFHDVEPVNVLWSRQLSNIDELEQVANEAQLSLSLDNGPLLRAVLAALPDGSQRLLLVIHHLVVDGVSWRVMLEDLQQAYQAAAAGQTVRLPAKSSSFKDWAEHLQSHAQADRLQQELSYWQAQLGGVSAELPCEYPDGGRQQKHAAHANTHLNRDWTRKLLQEAPGAYRTQVNDLLLAALARVIGRWAGHSDVLVRLEGHGREDLFADVDLTRTVGWFTSMYPVRLAPQQDLAGSIKAIKEQLRAVPNKGIGYGLLRYMGGSEARRILEQLPHGEIVFNYLGQFDGNFNEDTGLFVPAGEGSGTRQSDEAPLGSLLSLNGQVYDGELNLGWTFSREVFNEETIQRLANAYAEELKILIDHCCDEGNRGVTPSDFPLATLNQGQLDSLPIAAGEIADIYPLSPMQQGMLFHSLYDQGGGDYINQMRVDINGLDVEQFRLAWQAALEAHDTLRSSFVWQGDLERPVQVVRRHVSLPFVAYDWCAQQQVREALDRLAEGERRQGFDFAQSPLLRLVVVKLAEGCHHLIYTHHHILLDGWSSSQLLGEVLQRYAGQFPEKAIRSYRDYIAWLERQDPAASESFWKGQLATLDEPTRMALAIQPEREGGQGHADHHQVFDTAQTARLKDFARRHKVTVNTLLQSAWLLLLQRYTGQETVCFGATVAGRPAELVGVEEQVGLFINTLPVIAAPRPDQAVAGWIQQVQSLNLLLREFEHTPLYEVQRWAGLGGEPLFDTLLVFENYPVSEVFQQSAPNGLDFSAVRNHEQTNYPLTLIVALGEQLSIRYSYCRDQIGNKKIQRISDCFNNLLKAMLNDSRAVLGALPMISPGEQQLTHGRSNVEQASSSSGSVCQLIEAQVERRPDATAVIFGQEALSYSELNRRANRLAHKLRDLGVGPEILVGIALERSLEMVVGLFGILKAGGAYVPLDPEYPQERLDYMVEDSGIHMLLTQSQYSERFGAVDQIRLDSLDLSDMPDENPKSDISPDNLLCLLYTSGSTGQPKGVAIENGAINLHIQTMGAFYRITPEDRVLHFSSINFDWGTEQWLLPLVFGARVLVRDAELWDEDKTISEINRHAITVGYFPTQYAKQLAKAAADAEASISLRCFNVAGEALDRVTYDLIWKGINTECLVNGYGPTETVITPFLWRAENTDSFDTLYAPIGRPVSNRLAYLCSGDLLPSPVDAIAEIYIGGGVLARGYHHRPSMTAERFIPDPFDQSELGGGRLYRSGDLGRYCHDGMIEYRGRIDHQVKIRGFRIEMGEVEARLLEQDTIREAVVTAQEGAGGQQLVAYLIPTEAEILVDPGAQLDLRKRLRQQLKASLPDYMLPTHLLFLDMLPLTPNGKLDRRALPRPDAGLLQKAYVAPQSELEKRTAAIWAEVLQLEQVGLSDNFFDLGGHSLLATQVVSRVKRDLNIDVSLKDLFTSKDLHAFCAQLDGAYGSRQALEVELTKSLEVLKRLSADELEKLTT